VAEENTVFIGNKPPMNYVIAVITEFEQGTKEVVLKARGRAISRAVDAAEISRNRFMKDIKISDIQIGTEEVESEDGNKRNVSFMEIKLTKSS
jgi:DNA-binding protein